MIRSPAVQGCSGIWAETLIARGKEAHAGHDLMEVTVCEPRSWWQLWLETLIAVKSLS
jgi:hypothetical protein